MASSIVFARAVLAAVVERGFEGRAFLLKCALEPERLTDARGMLSVDELDRVVSTAMALTSDPGLGLSIGVSAPESMLQVLGQLIVAQPSIRDAFESLKRYVALFDDGIEWELLESGDRAMLSFVPAYQLGPATRCSMDYTLAMAMRTGRHFAPSGAQPIRVHCQHAAPAYAARYHEIFQCPVAFDQPSYGLVFPRAYLDREQMHGDPIMRTELSRIAEHMLAYRGQLQTTAERIDMLLRHEHDLVDFDLGRVARRLNQGVRGLRRKLQQEGTTLSSLLDNARCRLACDRLAEPDASVREIAEGLGFSEVSAFHRAFKRWTGSTVGTYRRKVAAR